MRVIEKPWMAGKKYDNSNHWNIIACQNLYWYIHGTSNGRNEAQENFKATSAEKKPSKHTVLTTPWIFFWEKAI